MKRLILLLSILVLVTQPVYAASQNDSRMLIDDGALSGGGGGTSLDKTKKSLVESLKALFSGERPPQNTNNPSSGENNNSSNTNESSTEETPVPTRTPGGLEVNQTFTALQELYDYVGNKVGVPSCVIKGVSYIEFPSVFDYTPGQVETYSKPGQTIPNCPWNSCSAAGHMQMTMGKDERGSTACNRCCWQGKCQNSCPNAWATHGRAVNEYDGASHTSNVCNLKDSTFAAARKLKKDSGTAANDLNWTVAQMREAGKRYYGNDTVKYERLGNRTYGEFLVHECNL